MGWLLQGGNANNARVSAFNRDFPDEPKFDAHGTDFRGFPEGHVRIGGRSSASRTRPYSIEFETSGVVSPENATCKQDCHSLRPMTAPGLGCAKTL
jgi:hypothetical protein